MKMLYVIGEPGVGKSTVVARLTRHCGYAVHHVPFVVWMHYTSTVMQLGNSRAQFSGTDALGMAAQKHVIKFMQQCVDGEYEYQYVLAEGDRLANGRFFNAVTDMGVELTVCTLLSSDQALLDERRNERALQLGREQNEQWLRGRSTKVVNLYADWGEDDWTFDIVTDQTRDIVRTLARHPVGRQFVQIRRSS